MTHDIWQVFFSFCQAEELIHDVYSSLKQKLTDLIWRDDSSSAFILNKVCCESYAKISYWTCVWAFVQIILYIFQIKSLNPRLSTKTNNLSHAEHLYAEVNEWIGIHFDEWINSQCSEWNIFIHEFSPSFIGCVCLPLCTRWFWVRRIFSPTTCRCWCWSRRAGADCSHTAHRLMG